MFYLGCDQHARQITICLRDEAGDVVQNRQVSTQPKKIREFLEELRQQTEHDGGYIAIVEVCGFNDWFLDLLDELGCRQVILVQPENSSSRKTDRRDAAKLSEQLWMNRFRIAEGKRIQGMRQVVPVDREDLNLRKLTQRRAKRRRQRGRILVQIKTLLRNYNLQHECPTKGLDTMKAFAWLRELDSLSAEDRLELDQLIEDYELVNQQLKKIDALLEIHGRRHRDKLATLRTIPGCGLFSALVLISRIGDLSRFASPRALANYFGLTPTCRNSGEQTKRLGAISKEGSKLVRFVLGLMITQVIRRDAWMRSFYGRIKKRRGAKIARVAVMRRLCTVIYRMLQKNEPYAAGGPAAVLRQRELIEGFSSYWGSEDVGSKLAREEMSLAAGG
jgi:transposase